MKNKELILIFGSLFFIGLCCQAMQDEDDWGEPEITEVKSAPVIPPPPGAEPVKVITPVPLPLVGTVNLEMTDKGFEGTFADKNKKLTVGPLVIDENQNK